MEEQQIEQQEEVKEVKKKPAALVKINEHGLFDFNNQQELANAARFAMQIKLVPESLKKDGLEAIMSALTLCKQYNLPNQAMNQMAYVKGKLTVYGSLFTALAQRHSKFGETKVFYINEECNEICMKNKNLKDKVWACVIQVKAKGNTEWNEYFFSLDDARQAGLLTDSTKPDSGWVKYTKDMLFHKAKSRAYKTEYASALEGVEYHEDIVEALEREVTPNAADELTKALG